MKHQVDIHVGNRIRVQRWLVGLTQKELADQVGIKFQQIQKYETGANRVSASRLWDIAVTMETSVAFFFEGLEGMETVESAFEDVLQDKEAIKLVKAYYDIPKRQREHLFSLAQALAS